MIKKQHMKLLVFEIQIICMLLKIFFEKYHLVLLQSVKNKLVQEKNQLIVLLIYRNKIKF